MDTTTAHDTRPPAERVRTPREATPPPRLQPPRHGTPDARAALVVARWMLAADDKFRFRGMRVRFLGTGWHG